MMGRFVGNAEGTSVGLNVGSKVGTSGENYITYQVQFKIKEHATAISIYISNFSGNNREKRLKIIPSCKLKFISKLHSLF